MEDKFSKDLVIYDDYFLSVLLLAKAVSIFFFSSDFSFQHNYIQIIFLPALEMISIFKYKYLFSLCQSMVLLGKLKLDCIILLTFSHMEYEAKVRVANCKAKNSDGIATNFSTPNNSSLKPQIIEKFSYHVANLLAKENHGLI